MTVEDDGPGLGLATTSHSHGIGLKNTRARLLQLYGDAAKLSIVDSPQQGVVALISLPYHLSAGDSRTDRSEAHEFDRTARR